MNSTEKDTFFDQNSGAFRAIFQSSNEGILVVDSQGRIKMSNPVIERMFGYTQQELFGKTVGMLVPNEQRGAHENHVFKYKQNPVPRKMGVGRDLVGQHKDGGTIPVEVSLSSTSIDDQRYTVAFIIDISTRVETEQALRRSEEQLITYAAELENRVKARTEDLNASVRKLEEINDQLQTEVGERLRAEHEANLALIKERELNELKSRFVSMASHEFRTPLSSILSSVSLIQKYIERDLPEKSEKHIGRIKKSVKNLTDILNDFLNLGKLEEGKIEVVKMEMSLGSLFNTVLEISTGVLKPNQTIRLDFEDSVIVSDEQLLRNILLNLISNASKYSKEGDRIDITTTVMEGRLQIDIKDQGIGIPENEQNHLFERFFRAKNATNIEGTGLGLNIVKSYTELLKGEVTFVSQLGKGTTMTVKLPL